MTGAFSRDWLALREPCDAAARSRPLAAAFLDDLPPRPRIMDLGAGTGANARYLDRVSAHEIAWLLIDRDAALLDRAAGLKGCATRQVLDFAADPAALDFSAVDGVAASALFDLVSEEWFARLLAAAAGLPLLLALTVDGVYRWRPADDADAAVAEWFERDLRTDKGFGDAMGASAPALMTARLSGAGYRVRRAASVWCLGGDAEPLLEAMIGIVAGAARRHGHGATVDGWRQRRRAALAAGGLRLDVAHVDILALPTKM